MKDAARSRVSWSRLKQLVVGVGRDFGPLIAYALIGQWFGVKAAVAAGVAAALGIVAATLWRREKIGAFLIFSTATTIIFGAVDLHAATPFLLRYEGAITNVVTGAYFLASIALGKPVLLEVAEKMMPETAPFTGNRRSYVRFLTWVWAGYFFAKAAFYAWILTILPFAEALVVRGLVGKISLVALLAGERVARDSLYNLMGRLGMLPEPVNAPTATPAAVAATTQGVLA